MSLRHSNLTARERDAFAALWLAGATTDDIRRVLPRHKERSDHSWRATAAKAGLPYFRDGEGSVDKSQIDLALLAKLVGKPRKL